MASNKIAFAFFLIIVLVAILGIFFLLRGGSLTAQEAAIKSKDSAVYNELQKDFSGSEALNAVAQDFLNWGLYGNVSVINQGQGTYRIEPVNSATVQFVENYSLAVQAGLPVHGVADIQRAANITQNDPDFFNCTPIRLGDPGQTVGGSHMDIVPVPSRLAWDLVQQTAQMSAGGLDSKNHQGIGMALNVKAITDEWCTFDNPYGITHYDGNFTVSDPRYSDLTNLQWTLMSQFNPRLGGGKVYSDFAWDNSNIMGKSNPDENGLRAALFNLWQLSPATYSMNDQKVVSGVEGARISLTQAAGEFKAIASLYPNGQIQTQYLGMMDPRNYYYSEMADRAGHGMGNTISAFVGGWNESEINIAQSYDILQGQNGPDQFLTKNWPSYDLVKFIEGYERINLKIGAEENGIYMITPSVLRMAGFPANIIGTNPTPDGAAGSEYAVGLPQNVAQSLQASFSNVLLGPGYTVSIYSCKDGLKADGVKDADVLYGDTSVYLMENGQ